MVKLAKETSLNRLLNKHTDSGYVMVSACRQDWDKADELHNTQMNNTKTEELKKDIFDSGFQYIPVVGGYVEKNNGVTHEEKSFIIVNYKRRKNTPEADMNELKEIVFDLCGKYNQDSVLVVEPGKKPTYYKRDGSVDFELGGSITVRNAAQEYFTRLGKGRQFSYLTETEQPATINGMRSRDWHGEICEMYGLHRK